MEAITNWPKLEQWIRMQNLVRWIISYDKVDAGEKPSRVLCNTFKENNLEENLKYTENCLNYSKGARLYIRGWRSDNGTTSPAYAEIQFGGDEQQGISMQAIQQMIGATQAQPSFNKEQLMKDIRQQVENEFERKELERQKKEIEEERKELAEQRNSALGLLANYLAPVAQALAGKISAPITGIQTAGGTVEADAIKPAAEPEAEDPFSDEEAEELEQLLVRLKSAEPEYMQLLRRVVELAEAHDSTYSMARGFLLK